LENCLPSYLEKLNFNIKDRITFSRRSVSFNLQINTFHSKIVLDYFESQYGLYSSFMACFVYTIFGSWKDVPVGPTAIAAILTRETLQKAHLGPDFAVLLCFISGCVSLLMGILQLGKIKKFNSICNIDITRIHDCQD